MSLMLDQTISTPCPAPRYPQTLKALHTPQLGLKIAPSRGIKPRRAAKGVAGWDPTLDIFDEVATNDESGGQSMRPQESTIQEQTTLNNSANIRKRRTSTLASPRVQLSRADNAAIDLKFINSTDTPDADTEKTDEVKKARRRTIYIPSEDTTMLTIHPGASLREQARRPRGSRRSDIFLDLAALSEEDGTSSSKAKSAKKETQAQRRAIGAAPRRAPLARNHGVLQVNGVSRDIAGSGGGKENLPPGWTAGSARKDASWIKPKRILEDADVIKPVKSCALIQREPFHQMLVTRPLHAKSKLSNATSVRSSPGSTHKQSSRASLFVNARLRWNTSTSPASQSVSNRCDLGLIVGASPRTVTDQAATHSKKVQPPHSLQFAPTPPLPSATIQQSTLTEQYPILYDDVAMPALYTSEHLTSQEIALSQVINDVFFQAGHGHHMTKSYAVLRKEMMCLHNTEDTVQLQQRLQASLRFGALSISKMALEKVGRIKDDLAQRQGFLDLWTKTYDLQLLQAAAEVVVGREISKTARVSGSPRSSTQAVSTEANIAQRQTKAIQAFLRTFLLRNEDAPKGHGSPTSAKLSGKTADDNNDTNSPAWLWRRTVVRSLLLIRLLDRFAPSNTSTSSSVCLFHNSSPRKTSASMLQTIGSLLIPSVGDPSRALNHFNYTVSYVQHPWQEYNYRVTNPAIDFRDSLLLARLIEIGVLRESASMTSVNTSGNAAKYEHYLTSTLHCPALTRTHKLHNARVILSVLQAWSLQQNNSLNTVLATLKAEDIVDGHREKTLSLLWKLVLECGGLETVVHRNVLEAEVTRLKVVHGEDDDCIDTVGLDYAISEDNKQLDVSTQNLLFEWARQCAIYHSIPFSSTKDLSTSLTNPNTRKTLYEAIVSTYSHSEDLAQTLKRAGYHDSKFVALYASTAFMGGEPDLHTKETSIALLALLARALLVVK